MEKTRTGASGVVKDKKEEKEDPKIVSIELLEGDNERTDAEVIQYVNIQQNETNHVDETDVTHVDRLGQKLRLKVKFDKPGLSNFTVKLESNNNVVYNDDPTSPESGNDYKYSESVPFTLTTGSNGEKIINIADNVHVSPAGGNVFTIKAVDKNGNEVTAKSKVKTKRLLYYVELNQKNLENNIHIGVKYKEEFESHAIFFKEIESGGVEIDFTGANVDRDHESIFNSKAQDAFNSIAAAVNKIPYCLGLAYVNRNVWGPEEDSISSPVIDINTLPGKKYTIPMPRHYLWLNVDNTIDWFISCVFNDGGGGEHEILKTECTPKKFAPVSLNENSVEIDLSKVSIPEGGSSIGKITLRFRRTNGVYAGDGAFPFTTTSLFNNASTQDKITQITIHETGHKMKLASDGSILDKTPDYYNQTTRPTLGHLGSHCYKPTSCVMYGATNGYSSFCTDCAKTAKKVNLKGGI